MLIISTLLLCPVIAFLYYYVIHLARVRRLINLIPGPSMVPIVGDIHVYNTTREKMWNLTALRFKRHNPIYKLWYFTLPCVSISHPDDLQIILNSAKYTTKGRAYKLLHPWLRDGLLVSKGKKWQDRRKILTPTFHFNILKRFFEIMIEESKCMTHSLKDKKGKTIENLLSFISNHTMNIISESAMGTSLNKLDIAEQERYRNAVYNLGEIMTHRLLHLWLHSDIIFSFTSKYKQQVECLKILHGFTEKIIAKRKQYHESVGGLHLDVENETEDNDVSRKKRLAMLDLLIMASKNNQLSDLDIREEVDTFMFEGHDTVAVALTFAILLLANHKDVQDRVRTEVNAVLEENGGKLTITALQNLSYLERCLKETLRLYPSVFAIFRNIDEDVKLQSYTVPAGTQIHIDICNIHRNPEFWPNPDVFDPDRFLPELVQNRHPFAYVPFSAGSRNCIGQRFAMMELKTITSMLVHNFYFEPIDRMEDIRLQIDLVIRSIRPLRVKFVPI